MQNMLEDLDESEPCGLESVSNEEPCEPELTDDDFTSLDLWQTLPSKATKLEKCCVIL